MLASLDSLAGLGFGQAVVATSRKDPQADLSLGRTPWARHPTKTGADARAMDASPAFGLRRLIRHGEVQHERHTNVMASRHLGLGSP